MRNGRWVLEKKTWSMQDSSETIRNVISWWIISLWQSSIVIVQCLFLLFMRIECVYAHVPIITKSPGLFSAEGRNSPTSAGTVIAMTLVSRTPLIYYYWRLITVLSATARYTWIACILRDYVAKWTLNSAIISTNFIHGTMYSIKIGLQSVNIA